MLQSSSTHGHSHLLPARRSSRVPYQFCPLLTGETGCAVGGRTAALAMAAPGAEALAAGAERAKKKAKGQQSQPQFWSPQPVSVVSYGPVLSAPVAM